MNTASLKRNITSEFINTAVKQKDKRKRAIKLKGLKQLKSHLSLAELFTF